MCTLPDDASMHLCDVFGESEIFQVVKEIAAWRAPGPDGMPVAFFHNLWHIIKKNIILHVQDLFWVERIFRNLILPIFV